MGRSKLECQEKCLPLPPPPTPDPLCPREASPEASLPHQQSFPPQPRSQATPTTLAQLGAPERACIRSESQASSPPEDGFLQRLCYSKGLRGPNPPGPETPCGACPTAGSWSLSRHRLPSASPSLPAILGCFAFQSLERPQAPQEVPPPPPALQLVSQGIKLSPS